MTASSYILLVEDEPGDARLTGTLLDESRESGVGDLPPMRWVQSADAAVVMLEREPDCAAVLLDLGLPDGVGLESLHALVQADDRVPIVVLTGNDNPSTGLDAVLFGAQDFLVKGHFDATTLQRSIAFAIHRKRAESALVQRSLRDDLTGLPRRTLLLDRLAKLVHEAGRTGTTHAVLFIDLDGFKQVNDEYGHTAGDEVLRTVAARLVVGVRAIDTVARLGGDEFVVLLAHIADPQDAVDVGLKLLRTIEAPIAIGDRVAAVSASIGVACFSDQSESADGLIRRADAAMYSAKADGKSRVDVILRPASIG